MPRSSSAPAIRHPPHRALVWVGLVVLAGRAPIVGDALAFDDTALLWAGLWSRCAEGADLPLPKLETSDLHKLAQGDVVRIRDRRGEQTRAMGVIRTSVPRDRLWLAALDPHFAAADEVKEHRLSAEGQWPNLWYQVLDLPAPFADRHWVIDVWNNHALAERTEGRCWEHAWQLHGEGPKVAAAAARGELTGVDAERAKDAIYTPVNEGAWWVISLPDGSTLLAYHVTTVVDGQIPDDLVVAYTWSTLGRVLKGVVARAQEVGKHYAPDHVPIMGGDGRAVPPNP